MKVSHLHSNLSASRRTHDLRHTAAYRMARDPRLPLTDVQWVLGHAHLSTTQLYLTPLPGDVITEILAHHRRSGQAPDCAPDVVTADGAGGAVASSGYRRESLDVLFGGWPR